MYKIHNANCQIPPMFRTFAHCKPGENVVCYLR